MLWARTARLGEVVGEHVFLPGRRNSSSAQFTSKVSKPPLPQCCPAPSPVKDLSKAQAGGSGRPDNTEGGALETPREVRGDCGKFCISEAEVIIVAKQDTVVGSHRLLGLRVPQLSTRENGSFYFRGLRRELNKAFGAA